MGTYVCSHDVGALKKIMNQCKRRYVFSSFFTSIRNGCVSANFVHDYTIVLSFCNSFPRILLTVDQKIQWTAAIKILWWICLKLNESPMRCLTAKKRNQHTIAQFGKTLFIKTRMLLKKRTNYILDMTNW